MFVISSFLVALARLLEMVFTILYWLIIIRALISWVSPDPFNPIVQFLYKTTEPLLYPIRRLLPFTLRFGIDISPIIAILLIMFFQSLLVRIILELAARLQ